MLMVIAYIRFLYSASRLTKKRTMLKTEVLYLFLQTYHFNSTKQLL